MTNRPAITWRKRGTGLPPKYGPAHTADPTATTLMGSRAYCGTWFPTGRDHLWANANPDDRRCRECERGAQRTADATAAQKLPDTPAMQRAEAAILGQGLAMHRQARRDAAQAAITAAFEGPKDQFDVMDDVTIAVHSAICETSPEDCNAWRGPCVRAVEAARTAITGIVTPILY